MFAPEQRFSDTMPVVNMACMCFTEWDTFSVQVDDIVSSSMVCLDRADSIFDGVLPIAEEALVAYVAHCVAVGAFARVSRRFAAPARVCKGSANWRLDLADGDADLVRDGAVVVGVPKTTRYAFGTGALRVVRALGSWGGRAPFAGRRSTFARRWPAFGGAGPAMPFAFAGCLAVAVVGLAYTLIRGFLPGLLGGLLEMLASMRLEVTAIKYLRFRLRLRLRELRSVEVMRGFNIKEHNPSVHTRAFFAFFVNPV